MDPVRIHTRVPEERVRKSLIRGSIIAGFGMALLLAAAIEMPLGNLQVWGFPILVLGILLIAVGIIPYKQVKRAYENPNELRVTDKKVQFFVRGKPTLSIPLAAVADVGNIDKEFDYGILFYLKGKVAIHDTTYKVVSREGADLYLPGFNRGAYLRLREALAMAGYSVAIMEGQ